MVIFLAKEKEFMSLVTNEDFVEKEYIKTKPKSVFDSMIKNFKKVTSLDKKYKLLLTVNQHKFSCILHDKPYSKYFHERDYF